jgi:hypothetical protein
VTSSLEFLVKQLYILHRKPFLLQMFGSIANNLENSDHSDPFKVNNEKIVPLSLEFFLSAFTDLENGQKN